MMIIEQLGADQLHPCHAELVDLLQNAVGHGASVGFLPPLAANTASGYWRGVKVELQHGTRILLVARTTD